MSDEINDGGPAFPNNDAHGCAYSGMTLLDWFAGQALMGFCSHPNSGLWTKDEVAMDSYSYADAMIKARKEVQNG
jgi:hypothetical protein